MIKKPVTIRTEMDNEGRPIAMLVQEASQYDSKVFFEVDNKMINAKSIMGMMSLRMVPGEEFVVVAEGIDEEEAVTGMEKFLTATE